MAGSVDNGGVGERGTGSGKRVKKLLDERRLVFVGSASAPPRSGRVLVVADEVDPPDHQRVSITTR